jgi:hypothetical protein
MRYSLGNQNLTKVYNGLDNLGDLLGLARLPGERNADYRARLESLFVFPGNASYDGLTTSINRELGLAAQPALTIQRASGGDASSSRVVVKNQTIYLFLYDLDLSYTFFLRDPAVSTLQLLQEAITNPGYFTASLAEDIDPQTYASTLLNVDSRVWVSQETVPAARTFQLQHSPIVSGTVSFSETQVFKYYQATPTGVGDFSLDLATGICRCTTQPSGSGVISYQYNQTELTCFSQSAVLLDLNSLQARNWFFTRVERDVWEDLESRYSQTEPYQFMDNIIQEIKDNCPALWGPGNLKLRSLDQHKTQSGWRWDETRWMSEESH